MNQDFKAMLATARLPERTVPICMRGDLMADHEAAERELELAQKDPVDSLAGNGGTALVERIESLQAQMRDFTAQMRMRALPKPQFRALIAAHPPRKGDDGTVVDADKFVGINADTFFDALIIASLVDPKLSEAEFAELAAVLTDRQYDQLSNTAWELNRAEVDVPFSLAASRAKRTIDAE